MSPDQISYDWQIRCSIDINNIYPYVGSIPRQMLRALNQNDRRSRPNDWCAKRLLPFNVSTKLLIRRVEVDSQPLKKKKKRGTHFASSFYLQLPLCRNSRFQLPGSSRRQNCFVSRLLSAIRMQWSRRGLKRNWGSKCEMNQAIEWSKKISDYAVRFLICFRNSFIIFFTSIYWKESIC